jgi:hypothetical protein
VLDEGEMDEEEDRVMMEEFEDSVGGVNEVDIGRSSHIALRTRDS